MAATAPIPDVIDAAILSIALQPVRVKALQLKPFINNYRSAEVSLHKCIDCSQTILKTTLDQNNNSFWQSHYV